MELTNAIAEIADGRPWLSGADLNQAHHDAHSTMDLRFDVVRSRFRSGLFPDFPCRPRVEQSEGHTKA